MDGGWRILLLLFLFRSGTDVCQARNKTADSLLVLLKNDRTDSNKVRHLNQLSAEFHKARNFDSASYYGNAALQLAGRLNFKRGMAVACIRIGAVYEGTEKLNEALEKYLASLKLFEEIEDKSGISDSYYNIGSIDWKTGSYDLALKNLSASLALKENIRDKKGIGSVYNVFGNVYYRQGLYDKALEAYFASLKIREEIGDKAGISGSYNNIANIYESQEKYDQALEKYFSALKLNEELGDKRRISVSYYNIANIYLRQGRYDLALKNDFESLKLKEEIADKQGIAASYNHIGDVYILQGNFDKALENQFASLKLFEEMDSKFSIANTEMSIGKAYSGKSDFNEAAIWLQKALKHGKEIGSRPIILDAYEALARLGEKTHNYAAAFEYYQLYSQLKDSIFNQKSSKQIAEMQTKYETEKKEKENELLVQQNLLQQSIIEKRTLTMVLLIGLLVFAVSIFIFVYVRYKLKQSALFEQELGRQQKLRFEAIIHAEEKERRRVAQELHDGLGQLLSTTKLNVSFLDHTSAPGETPVKNALSLIDSAIEEVRTISHNLMPGALIRLGLIPALKELVLKINSSDKIKVEFNSEMSDRLDETSETAIYRIVQESLNNMIKHSEASHITINLNQSIDGLVLDLKDDGIGFDTSLIEKSSGIGWKNIYARTALLNGSITVTSEPQRGTSIHILFPDLLVKQESILN